MVEAHVSIGQVKRDISELVNRVAYGRERIVLTSRGKPKAVLVSLADYERLQLDSGGERGDRLARWEDFLAKSRALSEKILARRGGEPLDVARIWEDTKAEIEERDARRFGG